MKELFQKIINGLTIFLIISIIIGFFSTDFSGYKPQIVTEEMRFEKEYLEIVGVKINEITDIATMLKDTNDKASRGEIVPVKVASNYQNSFMELESLYKEMSSFDVNNRVPNRYKVFNTKIVKSIEYLGVAVNEIVAYTNDKQETHLSNSDKAFESFYVEFDNSINMYNQLVFEREEG